MFEKFKNYSDSFLEVVLKEVDRRIDLKMNSRNFNYASDNSYETYYLKYIVPGHGDMERLTSLLKVLKGDRYMLLPIPWDGPIQKYATKEDSLNDLLEELNPVISHEINQNRDAYSSKMILSDTSDSLPLFFNGLDEFCMFLNLDSDDVEHYFIGTLILFPLNMTWFMIFDYDLFAIHFICKDDCLSQLGEEFKLNDFIYTEKQVEQLKNEAQE